MHEIRTYLVSIGKIYFLCNSVQTPQNNRYLSSAGSAFFSQCIKSGRVSFGELVIEVDKVVSCLCSLTLDMNSFQLITCRFYKMERAMMSANPPIRMAVLLT